MVRIGRYAYLLGPEANRFVFANPELFEVEEAFQALVPVDGPTSLIVSDGADHRRRRRLVQPALVHRRIAGYADVMRANTDKVLDGWQPGQTVNAYQEFRRAIRRSTIHALFRDDNYLANIINETLRLYPPAAISARDSPRPSSPSCSKRCWSGQNLSSCHSASHR